MRVLLASLILAAGALFFPRDASAAPAPPSTLESPESDPSSPAPLKQKEDWLVVAGLVCYVALPAIVTVVAVVLFVRFLATDVYGSGATARSRLGPPVDPLRLRPPPGVVLLRF